MAVAIIGEIPDLQVSEGAAVSIDLDQYFSGATAYAVSGLESGTGLSISGNLLSGTLVAADYAVEPITTTEVTITATDDVEGSETGTFTLTVWEYGLYTKVTFKVYG